MLRFLRHHPLSEADGEALWKRCVTKPIEEQEVTTDLKLVCVGDGNSSSGRPADGLVKILSQVRASSFGDTKVLADTTIIRFPL